jgi:colanic acid/amylovoran biosynthesis protein
MKYALTHCYTDHNKGDAAIIIATAQLIREQDPNAEINMFSTFGPNDNQFKNEHEFIKAFANNLYPGMFYQPRPVFSGSDASRLLHFAWILLKFSLLILTKNSNILRLFFTKQELDGVSKFIASDVILSKGGSYITTQNKSLRQSLSLFTMLYPFFLAKRYKKKMYIFSQSLGPVVGVFNQWLMKKALLGIEKIYLRESLCIERYLEVQDLKRHVPIEVIPDTAFYLKNEGKLATHSILIDTKKFNVGLTLVDHAFKYITNPNLKREKIKNYKNTIIETIKYLIDEQDAYIHIFPQVISENSHLGHSDVKISKEVEAIFKNLNLGSRVIYHHGDFNPMQLKSMYGCMDLFIGTRLHSVIFALSMNVPSINIAYHGTKSQGILGAIKGFEENVILIDDIYPSLLITKVSNMQEKITLLRRNLVYENSIQKKKLQEAMASIVSSIYRGPFGA